MVIIKGLTSNIFISEIIIKRPLKTLMFYTFWFSIEYNARLFFDELLFTTRILVVDT